MTKYELMRKELTASPKVWLVTGVAGFIGSNLLQELLSLNQTVIGLDNFSTGLKENLSQVRKEVGGSAWSRFRLIEGSVADFSCCEQALKGVDYVLHQAALGSVPRSIADPLATNEANILGHLNMIHAAKNANVKSFTYAASSSTYGDHLSLPKVENIIGNPLSPYAVTKYVNELYSDVFSRCYGFKAIGLRYFNVYGKRQNPNGAYAAVIPKWVAAMLENVDIEINGDGETSRDFCYIDNVIQANILAATADDEHKGTVYNVAVGDRTTLNELFRDLKLALNSHGVPVCSKAKYASFRAGDVRHSLASIEKISKTLGYAEPIKIKEGLIEATKWYVTNHHLDRIDTKHLND